MTELNTSENAIVLIAGHGGIDVGGSWHDGTFEKNHALEMTKKIYNHMKKYVNVYFFRKTDETLSLKERADNLNKLSKKYKNVDVYSNHFNAFNKKAEGVEICLSLSNSLDTTFAGNFLKEYSKKFNIKNRGILRRKSKKDGTDYYYMMRKTSNNVKFKYIEYGFGDNESDMKKMYKNFNSIAEFTAEKILNRYGFSLYKNEIPKWIVQAGAFSEYQNAENMVKKLKQYGVQSIIKKI